MLRILLALKASSLHHAKCLISKEECASQKIAINSEKLNKNQKILPAEMGTAGKNIVEYYFSKENLPFYKQEECYESKLDNFNNFKIIDNLL